LGFEFDFDPLSGELTAREFALPVDPTGEKSRKVFHVTLSDIPEGKWAGLLSAQIAAWQAAAEVYGKTAELEQSFRETSGFDVFDKILAAAEANTASSDAQGRAQRLVLVASREIVRWGVSGHRSEDFRFPKEEGGPPTPTPFEAEEVTWEKQRYRVASERMLRLYNSRYVRVLGLLADAVMEFQSGRVKTPEERWEAYAEAKRKAEEAAKKAVEAAVKAKGKKASDPLGEGGGEAPPN
jgi:hypothetical protein